MLDNHQRPYVGAEEAVMAKSQKRTSREAKKPKAVKAATVSSAPALASKATLAQIGGSKKKG